MVDGKSFKKRMPLINYLLLLALLFSLGINQALFYKINAALGDKNGFFEQLKKKLTLGAKSAGGLKLSGNLSDDVIKLAIATGMPDIYGPELSVSFDAAQQSINILKVYDPTYGKQKITLTGDDLKRYIEIGGKISCEYCCGAKAIVAANGQAACGCAHSQAMRGLAAYLIKNHPSEYNNDQILKELARWKGIFFPKQMIKKLTQQLQDGNYTPDTASLVMGIELPDYGGQSKEAPLPSEIENLPSMVGGC
ncbi:hypothetical protein C4569_02040 [Candidatus Parcubacteria bacterium]|nr:MAG: hypothetical protein C4569_02040 [Candidatus Parcubacteria bacterium]